MPESSELGTQNESYDYARWPEIKSLFDQALNIDSAGREHWLAEACRGDESLRKDVARLLSNYNLADGFLVSSPSQMLDQTFSEGTLLAQRFRIVRLIGTGGMGEVYEAEDITIEERMALKTLRPELAANPSLTSRLRRELQLSRQISHPNICRVVEFYQTSDELGHTVVFFTMELLKGETLAHRIASRGPMTIGIALPIIRQMAAGLAEVHRLGMVHRDLKPANIMLIDDGTRGERAVVMDFGLARDIRPGSASETRAGVLMGTPLYMAPEQFTGGPISVACDMYALGVTIFEMLTGRSHPLVSLRSLVPDTHAFLDQILLSCFDADPAKRPSSPTALVDQIEKRGPPAKKPARSKIVTFLAAACLVALSFVIWIWLPTAPQRPPVITRLTNDVGFTTDPAFSRDGKLLAYAADRGARGDLNIWLQRMDTGASSQLTDDPGNEDEPAISPDGSLVAYRSQRDNMLYVKPTAGGPARALAKWGQCPEFSPDGSEITYWTGQESEYTIPSGQIWTIPVAGGTPRALSSEFLDARYPFWSPNGRKLLFRGTRSTVPSLEANTDWWIVDAGGGPATSTGAGAILRSLGLAVQGSPVGWDGKTVVFSGSVGQTTNLWQIHLPVSRMHATGTATRLTTSTDRELAPTLLSDGRVAYANWRFSSHIWRLSVRSGEITQITDGDLTDSQPSVSRDGRFLVFWRRAGEQRDIILKDLRTGTQGSLISNQLADTYLSSDGRNVAYSLNDSVYFQDIGATSRSLVCRGCGEIVGRTPDGTGALLRPNPGQGNPGIDRVDLRNSTRQRIVSGSGLNDATIAPNNQWMAFTVRRNGVLSQVYVTRLNGGHAGAEKVAITPPDSWADNPVWSDDSRQIFYASDRDGFRCIWRQKIDQATLAPSGHAQAVFHFHRAAFSPVTIARSAFRLSLAGDSLFLNVGSVQGNLWILEP